MSRLKNSMTPSTSLPRDRQTQRRGVRPGARGGARKIRVDDDVGNPRRPERLPHPPGESDAGRECHAVTGAGEFFEREGRGVPCRHVFEHRLARSTHHIAPYLQSSASQIARSMRGAASTRVVDSVRAKAVSYSTGCSARARSCESADDVGSMTNSAAPGSIYTTVRRHGILSFHRPRACR